MIILTVLVFFFSSCVNGKREQSNSLPSYGIEIPLSWQGCKDVRDCGYNYDKCGTAYVFNKMYLNEFRAKADAANLVCYDYKRKPLVNTLNCIQKKCIIESTK